MLNKELEKIIQEIAFEQEKKNPGLNFNPGLALIGLRTTKLGPEPYKRQLTVFFDR